MTLDQLGTLEVLNVSKRYRGRDHDRAALENVNLTVAAGELVTIVGASGCGKTTLLRLLLGLEQEYDGVIRLDGVRIEGPDRGRGVVFQDHRLFPWLTVEQNVGLALHGRRDEAARRAVQEHIDLVGLHGFEACYPHQLSGGMSQRAAIARALVTRPRLLLLDEPLGALDALTRMYMHRELERIWQAEGISMVMVTHDVDEAVTLSDRIVIMGSRPGTVEKIVPVPLARPRDRTSHDFIRIREEVLAEFSLHHEDVFVYAI